MKSSLAATLKSKTQAHHRLAERAGLMRELLQGRIGRSSYCCLLRNLFELYAAMESALSRHCSHERVSPVIFPELFRRDALKADLRDLYGDGWGDDFAVQPTTLRYVDRLRELETQRPELLVGHAYVRYLGDLSGGQVLKRIVNRSLALTSAAGTRFLDFGEPADVVAKVRQFRSGLDSIAADSVALADIVAEAQFSFAMHARLFDELLESDRMPEPVVSVVDREGSHLSI